ncbi:hypothetical protein D9M68_792620 [compost metagenome]
MAAFHLAADRAPWLVGRHVALAAAVGVLGDEGRPLAVDDERVRVLGDIAHHALAHPLHGVGHQRAAHSGCLAFLLVEEDRGTGEAPVDAVSDRHPRQLAGARVLGVGRLGPVQRDTVTAGNQEQAGSCGRGAEVGGHQLVEVDLVPHPAQQLQEAVPGLAPALGVGHQVLLLHRNALTGRGYRAV